ncbi:hypothetical protein SDC9_158578 [bioreactor metagenome]|uniref:Uncharacterized protein n=1 Tax=bioreactor metagenome TaxID=1076179 RepID=A0A645FAJ0_9ZZZZ
MFYDDDHNLDPLLLGLFILSVLSTLIVISVLVILGTSFFLPNQKTTDIGFWLNILLLVGLGTVVYSRFIPWVKIFFRGNESNIEKVNLSKYLKKMLHTIFKTSDKIVLIVGSVLFLIPILIERFILHLF